MIAQQVALPFPSQRCTSQVLYSASVILNRNYNTLHVAELRMICCLSYHFDEREVFVDL